MDGFLFVLVELNLFCCIMAEAATPELVHEYVERIGDVARAELEVE